MGWNSANEIFDPVAQAMIDEKCSYGDKVRVLGVLIHTLQENDWDTEDESLDLFEDDAAVVEAFRQQGIFMECYETNPEPIGHGVGRFFTWCVLEENHPCAHMDRKGHEWPLH